MSKYIVTLIAAIAFGYGSFAQQKAALFKKSSNTILVQPGALNFFVIGDWGRQGEFYQQKVADAMADAAAKADPEFFISTGDNFYPDGVASVSDPLWKTSFEEVYKRFDLQKKWYVVLGNHDYHTNPDAEVEYTKISGRWNMPSKYFARKFSIDDDTLQQVLFVFLDTSPFVKKYYTDQHYGHIIAAQDTATQLRWLRHTLSDTSSRIKWKIVVGHHPPYTGGKRFLSPDTKDVKEILTPVLTQYGVDIYLAGHEHHLEHTKPEGKTHYFISGSGSEVRPVKLYPQIGKFAAAEAGFASFSITAAKTVMNFIDHEGKVLYQQELHK